jgi:hypothetical protein
MYFVRVLAPQPVVAVARKTFLTIPCHTIAIPIVIFGTHFTKPGTLVATRLRQSLGRCETERRYDIVTQFGEEQEVTGRIRDFLTCFTDTLFSLDEAGHVTP